MEPADMCYLAHHMSTSLLKCATWTALEDIFSLSALTRPCITGMDTAHDALPKHNGTPDHQ